MHDEAEIDAGIALAARPRRRGRLAKARGPGERKNVKIEIAGGARTAPRLDSERQDGGSAGAVIRPDKGGWWRRQRGAKQAGPKPSERTKSDQDARKTRPVC